jgi:hypothetical protein
VHITNNDLLSVARLVSRLRPISYVSTHPLTDIFSNQLSDKHTATGGPGKVATKITIPITMAAQRAQEDPSE